MVKRENETDNRLIRYLIALPNGVDVTNHIVLKEYSEVLKKINIDIKDCALQHIKLNIEDIMNEEIGILSMTRKLQLVLKRLDSENLKVPPDLASVILSQGAITSSVVLDIFELIEKPSRFEESFKMCNVLCMKRVEGALAKRHGSREVVTHETSVKELHRLVSKDIYDKFSNIQEAHDMIPSDDYLLKHFTPKNSYAMKADRYFSKLPFQLSLSGRSNHVKHIDFYIVKKYMKEYAVGNRKLKRLRGVTCRVLPVTICMVCQSSSDKC